MKFTQKQAIPVYAIPADLTNGVLVRGAIEQAAEKLGGLDILVTNAGGPPPGKFEDFALEQWQGAFDSLLMSVVLMVETALPYFARLTNCFDFDDNQSDRQTTCG